ncbi:MAG: hypothetical protein PVJ39_08880 [Gammaproteobacteria bacterium]|jgi:hypothetical protein
MRLAIVSFSLALLFITPAQAADLGGRFKLDAIGYDAGPDTPEAGLDFERSNELAAQLRLEWRHNVSPWDIDVAWQFDSRHGSAVEKDYAMAASYPFLSYSADDNGYWDMTDDLVDGGATYTTQRLDRLNVSYTATAFVIRLGRQALTWGSGLVFHPLDLVNPFQPVATDTAYKRGTDMAYGQWLMDDGSDIQFVVVPHKTRNSIDPNAGKATQAVFANLVGDVLQWTVLLAKDRSDTVMGIGASGSLAGAAWNMEAVPTRLDGGGTRTSALLNITQADTFLNRNITMFAELYRNGFGEKSSDYTLVQLNSDLVTRLERGQQFVTGRDYVSLGATYEWTALLQVMPTYIVNLQDHSSLLDVQLSYSLSNDVLLKGGIRLAFGDQGSEFGGLELAPLSNVYLAKADQAFARLEMYF